MENRRQDYRHTLTGPHRFMVQMRSSDGTREIAGEIIDLSIGGICTGWTLWPWRMCAAGSRTSALARMPQR